MENWGCVPREILKFNVEICACCPPGDFPSIYSTFAAAVWEIVPSVEGIISLCFLSIVHIPQMFLQTVGWFEHPLSSSRQHLSYDVCLEVREEIVRTVLCCIVY